MSFRFLFLDSDGREIRLTSREELRRAVATGDLDEDMLLYDAETSEWSPARTHPLVREALEDPDAEESGRDDDASASGRSSDTLRAGDLSGLTLTSTEAGEDELEDAAAEGMREDETVRAFRERLERERKRQEALGPGTVAEGLSMKRGDRIADLHDPTAPAEDRPADSPPSPAEPRAADPDEDETEPTAAPLGSTEPIGSLDTPAWSGGSTPRRTRPPGTRRQRRSSGLSAVSSAFERGLSPQAAILALLIGVLGWGIADALATSADPPEAGETTVAEDPPAIEPEPAPEPTEFDLSASTYVAFTDMQRGMERLGSRLGVAEPPTDWLSGRYLADAATLPEVRDFWVRYGAFVDSVRVREEELFRAGYLSRLRDEGVAGSTLSIRLSGALQDFRADRPRREQIYRTMDALAAEALLLDAWLREHSDRIAFAGVRGGAVSLAPEIEAAPLDDETRRELDARLNRVLDALERVTGPDPSRARAITGRIVTGPPPDTAGDGER